MADKRFNITVSTRSVEEKYLAAGILSGNHKEKKAILRKRLLASPAVSLTDEDGNGVPPSELVRTAPKVADIVFDEAAELVTISLKTGRAGGRSRFFDGGAVFRSAYETFEKALMASARQSSGDEEKRLREFLRFKTLGGSAARSAADIHKISRALFPAPPLAVKDADAELLYPLPPRFTLADTADLCSITERTPASGTVFLCADNADRLTSELIRTLGIGYLSQMNIFRALPPAKLASSNAKKIRERFLTLFSLRELCRFCSDEPEELFLALPKTDEDSYLYHYLRELCGERLFGKLPTVYEETDGDEPAGECFSIKRRDRILTAAHTVCRGKARALITETDPRNTVLPVEKETGSLRFTLPEEWEFFAFLLSFRGETVNDGDREIPAVFRFSAFPAEETYRNRLCADMKNIIDFSAANADLFVLKKEGEDKIKYPVLRMAGFRSYIRLTEKMKLGKTGKCTNLADPAVLRELSVLLYLHYEFSLTIAADPANEGMAAEKDAAQLRAMLNAPALDKTAAKQFGKYAQSLSASLAKAYTGKTKEKKYAALSKEPDRLVTDVWAFDAVYGLFRAACSLFVPKRMNGALPGDLTAFYALRDTLTESEIPQYRRWLRFFNENFNLNRLLSYVN